MRVRVPGWASRALSAVARVLPGVNAGSLAGAFVPVAHGGGQAAHGVAALVAPGQAAAVLAAYVVMLAVIWSSWGAGDVTPPEHQHGQAGQRRRVKLRLMADYGAFPLTATVAARWSTLLRCRVARAEAAAAGMGCGLRPAGTDSCAWPSSTAEAALVRQGRAAARTSGC